MAVKKKRPTQIQKKYIECYNGSILETAKLIGISYPYARQLMCLPKYRHVQLAIANREKALANKVDAKELKKRTEELEKQTKLIATRHERQQFWTNVLQDKLPGVEVALRDRLKASELLARSEGDFIERRKLEFDKDSLRAIFQALPSEVAAELRIRLASKLGLEDS